MRRRRLLAGALGLATAPVLGATARPRVVVVGAGAGGAACARRLVASGDLEVVLVERRARLRTCVFSNQVLAGLREPAAIEVGLAGLTRSGVSVRVGEVVAIEAAARRLVLAGGSRIGYDRLVVAPGVSLATERVAGYDRRAAERMPHAYLDGAEAVVLGRRLRALPRGGTVLVVAPPRPYRCPPAPYERVSLIAHYLRRANPRAKVLVLDYKDAFIEQDLFEAAWARFYEGMVEWLPAEFTGGIRGVDAGAGAVLTPDERFTADLVSFIPPQRAGALAAATGLAGPDGWCPVEPRTLASLRLPAVHVIGDAVGLAGMPKSAYAAASQAVVCAAAVRAALGLGAAPQPRYESTCWSLVAPGHAIKTGERMAPAGPRVRTVEPFGSVLDEDDGLRARAAAEAERWFVRWRRATWGR